MFDINSTAKKYPTRIPYENIKKDILGAKYALTLNFIGNKRARDLNISYRGKDYSPNVLSFPLTEDTGEIFITPVVATKEAKKFSMTPNGYIGYLFIHGCLHLQGHDHGEEMDKQEKKYLKKYKLK